MADIRALYARMGFTQHASVYLQFDQAIDSAAELANLDDDGVEILCKAMRKSGGQIADPAEVLNGNANPALIDFAGYQVPLMAEENLRLTSYYCRHRLRVQRPIDITTIQRATVRALKQQKKAEDDHTEPTNTPTIDAKNWPQTIDSIDEYLRGILGDTKVPLAYVVRVKEEVTAAADDPATNYSTLAQEMIARAPIDDPANPGTKHPTFVQDNSKVWALMQPILVGTPAWPYARSFARNRDGQGAMLAIRNHFLGTNTINNRITEAESKLSSSSYNGERRRWNFEAYVRLHTEQHAILAEFEERGSYKGLDERSKVRLLLNGIKTGELDAVKTTVWNDQALQADFNRCVGLFKSYITQRAMSSTSINVSQVSTSKHGKNHEKKKTNGKSNKQESKGKRKRDDEDETSDIEDRYYKASEYSKLTTKQKDKLRKLRDERERKVVAALEVIPTLQATVAAIQTNQEDVDDEETDDEPTPKAMSNRNNPALKRKKGPG